MQKAQLETIARRTISNVSWGFGNVESTKALLKRELDALGEEDNARRAQTLLRFGIIDSNPDGQAAVFAAACAAESSICEPQKMKDAALSETRARHVSPGDVLPLYFIGGHP
ncbi:MAG TPA: hypothetical protein VFQ61_25705 [Polyangiaceae bacterium]|nr:hypothetical protein [Polyangiaceae bacterium]